NTVYGGAPGFACLIRSPVNADSAQDRAPSRSPDMARSREVSTAGRPAGDPGQALAWAGEASGGRSGAGSVAHSTSRYRELINWFGTGFLEEVRAWRSTRAPSCVPRFHATASASAQASAARCAGLASEQSALRRT